VLRLLAQLCVGRGGSAGLPSEALTPGLAGPLVRCARAPWQLPRIAALCVLQAWAPRLAWRSTPGAREALEELISDGLTCGDAWARAAAARLAPTLSTQLGGGLPQSLQKALASLSGDWSADVRDAWVDVEAQLSSQKRGSCESETQAAVDLESRWEDTLWDSVYVTEVPCVRNRMPCGRCALDRFEDFLDASERAGSDRASRSWAVGGTPAAAVPPS